MSLLARLQTLYNNEEGVISHFPVPGEKAWLQDQIDKTEAELSRVYSALSLIAAATAPLLEAQRLHRDALAAAHRQGNADTALMRERLNEIKDERKVVIEAKKSSGALSAEMHKQLTELGDEERELNQKVASRRNSLIEAAEEKHAFDAEALKELVAAQDSLEAGKGWKLDYKRQYLVRQMREIATPREDALNADELEKILAAEEAIKEILDERAPDTLMGAEIKQFLNLHRLPVARTR